jgi:hypothetical protein
MNFGRGTVLFYQVKFHSLAPRQGALVFVDQTSTASYRHREATAA